MHVAVELGFDPASELRIRNHACALANLHGGPDLSAKGVRPHISLTSFAGGEPGFLGGELARLARCFAPFGIRFDAAKSFPTEEGVVYLALCRSEKLLSLHAALHRAMALHGREGHSFYRPGRWVPHCTVATGVPADRREQIVEICKTEATPMEVVVETVHARAYLPVRALHSLALVGEGGA